MDAFRACKAIGNGTELVSLESEKDFALVAVSLRETSKIFSEILNILDSKFYMTVIRFINFCVTLYRFSTSSHILDIRS